MIKISTILFKTLQSNVLDYQSLQKFSKNKIAIYDEFKEVPQISLRLEEENYENVSKNRYANVVPFPLETIVKLEVVNNDENSRYINANYVKVSFLFSSKYKL